MEKKQCGTVERTGATEPDKSVSNLCSVTYAHLTLCILLNLFGPQLPQLSNRDNDSYLRIVGKIWDNIGATP